MKDRHWISLIGSLQAGQCVLVVGPDIPADWGGREPGARGAPQSVRDALCRDLGAQLEEEGQRVTETALFAIAQQYQETQAFKTTNLKSMAADFFRQCEARPSALHRKLAELPFKLVLTTCHDHLMYRALGEVPGKSAQYLSYHYCGEPRDNDELPSRLTPESPVVYHLFGEFTDPPSLVLTENDLLDFIVHIISGNPKLPDSLKNALRNKTFLFIGFGIRYWYIRVLLKLLIKTLDLGGGSIALETLGELTPEERSQTVLFYRRGAASMEVVAVDLTEFLDQLADRLERAGGYQGAHAAPKPAQVFISYERSDGAIAEKLHGALPKDAFDAWLDTQLLQGGEDWNQTIEERIRSCDFFLVINGANLANKREGYVNKEIELALDRRKYFQPQAKFLIPLNQEGSPPESGRPDLLPLNQLPLRDARFAEDVEELVRTMKREMQLRSRR